MEFFLQCHSTKHILFKSPPPKQNLLYSMTIRAQRNDVTRFLCTLLCQIMANLLMISTSNFAVTEISYRGFPTAAAGMQQNSSVLSNSSSTWHKACSLGRKLTSKETGVKHSCKGENRTHEHCWGHCPREILHNNSMMNISHWSTSVCIIICTRHTFLLDGFPVYIFADSRIFCLTAYIFAVYIFAWRHTFLLTPE